MTTVDGPVSQMFNGLGTFLIIHARLYTISFLRSPNYIGPTREIGRRCSLYSCILLTLSSHRCFGKLVGSSVYEVAAVRET